MRNYVVLCLVIIVMTGLMAASAQAQAEGIPGETRALVNLRSGPGSRFEVITVLPAGARVMFVGRNQSSTWLLTSANGFQGWLSYTFVNVDGDVRDLPIVGSQTPVTTSGGPHSVNISVPSAMDGVIPEITPNVRTIYLRGQELGNHADVFAKVGDSLTASSLFLTPIGLGGLRLFDYEYLRPVVEFFSQTPARDHYSFANTSLAARGGWTSADVLNPALNVPGICRPGEAPLECEYRTNRPSIALIMFGTNDVGFIDSRSYRANMERIVQLSLDMGVIPVLSTIPDRLDNLSARVLEFNAIITDITQDYDIPLWNYWLALQNLPNRGLGGDNVHPSYDYTTNETAIFSQDGLRYGFNMRNLTALMVLDAIWRGAMY